jgi:Fic family protein
LKQIVRWAEFLVKGRAEIKYEKIGYDFEPIAANKPEAPYKVINYFKELARGHALIHERKEIEQADIEFISHIAISSIPIQYRYIIRELREKEIVDTVRCMFLCSTSRPTARKYLKELSLLGIAKLTKGSAEMNEADKITLAEEFQWLKFKP